MSSVMVMVDVQDATVESLSAGLQSERVAEPLEAALRNALNVPVEKRVMIEPFRNGLVLSVATSITVRHALRAALELADADARTDQTALDADELRTAYAAVCEGLRVVSENGG